MQKLQHKQQRSNNLFKEQRKQQLNQMQGTNTNDSIGQSNQSKVNLNPHNKDILQQFKRDRDKKGASHQHQQTKVKEKEKEMEDILNRQLKLKQIPSSYSYSYSQSNSNNSNNSYPQPQSIFQFQNRQFHNSQINEVNYQYRNNIRLGIGLKWQKQKSYNNLICLGKMNQFQGQPCSIQKLSNSFYMLLKRTMQTAFGMDLSILISKTKNLMVDAQLCVPCWQILRKQIQPILRRVDYETSFKVSRNANIYLWMGEVLTHLHYSANNCKAHHQKDEYPFLDKEIEMFRRSFTCNIFTSQKSYKNELKNCQNVRLLKKVFIKIKQKSFLDHKHWSYEQLQEVQSLKRHIKQQKQYNECCKVCQALMQKVLPTVTCFMSFLQKFHKVLVQNRQTAQWREITQSLNNLTYDVQNLQVQSLGMSSLIMELNPIKSRARNINYMGQNENQRLSVNRQRLSSAQQHSINENQRLSVNRQRLSSAQQHSINENQRLSVNRQRHNSAQYRVQEGNSERIQINIMSNIQQRNSETQEHLREQNAANLEPQQIQQAEIRQIAITYSDEEQQQSILEAFSSEIKFSNDQSESKSKDNTKLISNRQKQKKQQVKR